MSLANRRKFRAAYLLIGAFMLPALVACVSAQSRDAATENACIASPDDAIERHGCANAANLRAMAADPADLSKGRTLAPANGERETRAVEAYQLGQTKPFDASAAPAPANITTGAGP